MLTPRVPCTRSPDTAAKIPCEQLPSTFTTVADTSVATHSDWVRLDVALRQMSGAAASCATTRRTPPIRDRTSKTRRAELIPGP